MAVGENLKLLAVTVKSLTVPTVGEAIGLPLVLGEIMGETIGEGDIDISSTLLVSPLTSELPNVASSVARGVVVATGVVERLADHTNAPTIMITAIIPTI